MRCCTHGILHDSSPSHLCGHPLSNPSRIRIPLCWEQWPAKVRLMKFIKIDMTLILSAMHYPSPLSVLFFFLLTKCALTCSSNGRLLENVEKQLPHALPHFSLLTFYPSSNISWLTDIRAGFVSVLCTKWGKTTMDKNLAQYMNSESFLWSVIRLKCHILIFSTHG